MRVLLLAGFVGPLLFIGVFLVAGATRPGYDPWRMFVSQLATGPGGWVQVANFFMCGVLVLLFSLGLHQALAGTRGSVGAPVFLSVFGASLLFAGAFTTDPVLGYPPGASEVRTVHGTIHNVAGLVTFTFLPVACFVMSWHFAGGNETWWSIYSAVAGATVLLAFFGGGIVAGETPNSPSGLFQRIAIITGWTWIAATAWLFSGL